jgi:hypothetical protein
VVSFGDAEVRKIYKRGEASCLGGEKTHFLVRLPVTHFLDSVSVEPLNPGLVSGEFTCYKFLFSFPK